MAKIPHILVVADTIPTDSAALGTLMARADLRFDVAKLDEASASLLEHDFAAAVVVAEPGCLSRRQQELLRICDALAERHIGAILLTFSREDLAAAERFLAAEGLMAVAHTATTDDLAGRLAGLLAMKPVVDQLARENLILRKFDTGLNTQMTQIDEEMRLAARLQVDFLPRTLPELNGCRFDVLFRPASYVSGDIYDAVRFDEDHIGFYVADAVGHGMPAALLTIFLKRTLRTKEIHGKTYRIVPPNEALASLNNEMLNQQLSMCQFVTMAYCVLNTRTLELQYARAGHPLPLHLTRAGQVRELELEGALLGVFPDEQFPLARVQLSPGDRILLYSDGFETAFSDPSGVANDRYREEFARLTGADARERFLALGTQLDVEEGSLHPRDDITAIMLSVDAA